VAADLPAVISVVKEINEPRVPSFKAKLKAKKEIIPVWGLAEVGVNPEEVGLTGSFTQVVKVFPPPPRGKSEVWEGQPAELAARVWTRLKELGRS
jgi:electron transfer flavoprotein beta subunit